MPELFNDNLHSDAFQGLWQKPILEMKRKILNCILLHASLPSPAVVDLWKYVLVSHIKHKLENLIYLELLVSFEWLVVFRLNVFHKSFSITNNFSNNLDLYKGLFLLITLNYNQIQNCLRVWELRQWVFNNESHVHHTLIVLPILRITLGTE